MRLRPFACLMVLVLASCGFGPSGTGDLLVSLSGGAGARALVQPTLTGCTYSIECSGPGGAATSYEGPSGQDIRIRNLSTGSWRLEASQRDGSGTVVSRGATDAEVAAEATTNASIVLSPVAGIGTLAVSLSWSAGQFGDLSVSATLESADGSTSVLLPFSPGTDGASCGTGAVAVPAGYWTLRVRLHDAVDLPTITRTVLVLDGKPTALALDLGSGTLAEERTFPVDLLSDTLSFREITLSFQAGTFPDGTLLTLTETGRDALDVTLPWDLAGVGPAYLIRSTSQPEGPVTVTIPYAGAQAAENLLAVHARDGAYATLVPVIDADAGTVTFPIEDFSGVGVFEDRSGRKLRPDEPANIVNATVTFDGSMGTSGIVAYDQNAGLLLNHRDYWGTVDDPTGSGKGKVAFCAAMRDGSATGASSGYSPDMDAGLEFYIKKFTSDMRSVVLEADVYVSTEDPHSGAFENIKRDFLSLEVKKAFVLDEAWAAVVPVSVDGLSMSTDKGGGRRNLIFGTGGWKRISWDLTPYLEAAGIASWDGDFHVRFLFHSDGDAVPDSASPSGAYLDDLRIVKEDALTDAPPAPPVLYASTVGSGMIRLAWDAEDVATDRYIVRITAGTSGEYPRSAAGARSLDVTGLTSMTEYRFTIQTVRTDGWGWVSYSAESAELSVTTADDDPPPDPGTPTNTSANMPSSYGGRAVQGSGRCDVASRNVTLYVWDSGSIDGDIVSLVVNGSTVLSSYTLEGTKMGISVTLGYLGYNYLLLYAHNEGDTPPNTCAVSVYDGATETQLTLSADLSTNGAVSLYVDTE